MEEETDGERSHPTPEMHYDWAMDSLYKGQSMQLESLEYTNCLLTALTHAMMGGLRDGLDYSAKQKASELAESRKPGYGTPEAGGVGAQIEEDDDDRP